MLFSREHLKGDYNWADEATQTTFTGSPSRRLFNRYNGEQVLFVINLFANSAEPFDVKQGQQMEEFLIHHLPLEAKSEISVFNWLKETFMPGVQAASY